MLGCSHSPCPGPPGEAGAGPHLPSSLIHSSSLLWCAWGHQLWPLVALHQAKLEGEGENGELGLSLLQSAELCCLPCWDGSPQLTLSLPHAPGVLQLPVCGQVSLPAEPSPEVLQTNSHPTACASRCQKLCHVSTLGCHRLPALPTATATALRPCLSQELGRQEAWPQH